MKRDMNLIRSMLLAVEASDTGWAPDRLTIEGYDPKVVGYHSYLIVQSGLCEGIDITGAESIGPEAVLTKLTWAGHEFLDAARDETRWRKAMSITAKSAGTITIGALTQLLTSLMMQSLGIGNQSG